MRSRTALRVSMVCCAWLGCGAAANSELIVGYSGDSSDTATAAPASEAIATSAAPDQDVKWDLPASPGDWFSVDLTALEIQFDRTGHDPRQSRLAIPIAGGVFRHAFTDKDAGPTARIADRQTINLSSYESVASAIFRLHADETNSTLGQLGFNSSVNSPSAFGLATPEPGSLAAFGIGALAAGYAGWRRRKATAAQKA